MGEADFDRLLRGETLLDVYAVVSNSGQWAAKNCALSDGQTARRCAILAVA